MPKKTTILIIILTIVTAGLVFLAIKSEQKIPSLSQTSTPKTQPASKVEKTSTLFFAPSSLNASSGSSTLQTTDIMINTGKDSVTGVQIELSYDPKILSNVQIASPVADSFFGTSSIVLFKEVNQELGRISFASGIAPQETPKSGVGKVATLTFTAAKPLASDTAMIKFVDKSMVSHANTQESVLKETIPLTILFSSPSPFK